MPHRGLSESTAGPEPIELRVEGTFDCLSHLEDGGESWSDSGIAGGGGTLREADLASDAPKTNTDLMTLTSRVHEYATSISDALDRLKTASDEDIRVKTAKEITRTLGFLNAWMDHLYTHPAYKATETLRQEGLDNLLRFKNPTSVTAGIAQMRQFIAAVFAIDFAEAVEVPYDRLYLPESAAAFQERRAAYEAKKAKAEGESHATPAADLAEAVQMA